MELFFNYGRKSLPRGTVRSRTAKIHFSNNEKSLMELTESFETVSSVSFASVERKMFRSCNVELEKNERKKNERKNFPEKQRK